MVIAGTGNDGNIISILRPTLVFVRLVMFSSFVMLMVRLVRSLMNYDYNRLNGGLLWMIMIGECYFYYVYYLLWE